jgi:putative ABC transport system ATP-binding protein
MAALREASEPMEAQTFMEQYRFEGQPVSRQPIIQMQGIRKTYNAGKPNELEILHGIDLTVYPGEFVAIVGESGSGKSTLMNMIGALDRPSQGTYFLDGVNVETAKDAELSDIRNRKVGFVFQTFNLIGRQSALKNVELPMLYAKVPARQRTERAKELLDMVGMTERMKHQPSELSGGQKQRVAIARAMANDPALLLADEPTGALDSATSRTVMDIFHDLHEKRGKTIVLITHNPQLAEECSRVLTLLDGRIVAERKGAGRNVG